MKILIVKLGAFGDLIHALPALDDLLNRSDVEEIHWLVDERYAFVTEIFPSRVIVHTVALKGAHPIRSAWHTVCGLRAIRFDAVLDMQGLIKSGILARLIGGSVYGVDARFVRESLNRVFVRPVCFHSQERHVVQQYRRIAHAPFSQQTIPDRPLPYHAPHITVSPEVKKAGLAVLDGLNIGEKDYVILHIGGGWATKQLPDTTWQKLAKMLLDEGIIPLISWGTEAEHHRAEQHAAHAPGALVLAERLPMNGLCGTLSHARAVVGADTGIVHLAAALATPTISFWGPSASRRSAPLGSTDRQIESNPTCSPCFKRSCHRFICMKQIHAADLLRAIHDVA